MSKTKECLNIRIVDDGTLDTIISVEGKLFRFTYDGCDDSNTYEEFIEWAKQDAINQYYELLAN